MDQTPLARYAESLRASGSGASLGLERKYPMFVIPLWFFLRMREILKHEDLLEAGSFCQYDHSMGRTMFVSHQWLGTRSPDPTFEQLRILQKMLMHMMSGAARVSLPIVTELWFGRIKLPRTEDFTQQPLYLWYDYFCIPQGAAASEVRQNAISSIPSYISESYFFVILCPSVTHEEGHVLGFESWAERGWCRLERMARNLSREDGFLISVQVASLPTLANDLGGLVQAPGKGSFSIQADRSSFGPVLVKMMWAKLHNLLFKGDLHEYRFLLNLQRHYFGGLGIEPMESLVPGFCTEIDPSTDPYRFVVAKFLHENGFNSVGERDKQGWSPMCYAVLRDDPFLVESMLICRADVNDTNHKVKKDAQLPKGMPVLALCGTYHSNQAMKALLLARANVNAKDGLGGFALTASIGMDNTEGVRILSEANIDPNVKLLPGTGPFKVACGFARLGTIREFMRRFPEMVNLRFCLHFGVIFNADVQTVSFLLESSADINEQLEIPMRKKGWWLLLKLLSFRHKVSPSALTYLAYNHRGATPLMLSIMTGKFDVTALLLSMGARLDLVNYRGKSAADIVEETRAPISLEGSEDDDSVIAI